MPMQISQRKSHAGSLGQHSSQSGSPRTHGENAYEHQIQNHIYKASNQHKEKGRAGIPNASK